MLKHYAFSLDLLHLLKNVFKLSPALTLTLSLTLTLPIKRNNVFSFFDQVYRYHSPSNEPVTYTSWPPIFLPAKVSHKSSPSQTFLVLFLLQKKTLRKPLILCPPYPHALSPSEYHCNSFIEGCMLQPQSL